MLYRIDRRNWTCPAYSASSSLLLSTSQLIGYLVVVKVWADQVCVCVCGRGGGGVDDSMY